jgi:hypothetical protein
MKIRTTHPAGSLSTEHRQVLLLCRVAIALAAYHQHVEAGDYDQAARMLGATSRKLVAVEVGTLIA